MLLSLPLLIALLTTTTPTTTKKKANNKPNYIKTDHLLLQKIQESPNGVVWVDLENVRGKSGFELTHMEALEKTTIWTNYHELNGKVIFVVDHGSQKCGYYLEHRDLAVVFAGPSEKADDVIAKGVGLFDGKLSIVITADGELKSRCRRSAQQDLHIMDPAKFLDDLELAVLQSGKPDYDNEDEDEDEDEETTNQEDGDESSASSSLTFAENVKLGKLDDEIRLRGQVLDAEIQMGKKRGMTNKRRKKLQSKINALRQKLTLQGPSLLDQVTSLDPSRMHGMDRYEQDLLLSRWKEIQHRSPRREQTGDRVVYAERLRRQLLETEEPIVDVEEEAKKRSPAQAFVMHMNNGLVSSTILKSDGGAGANNSPSAIHATHTDIELDFDITPPEKSTYDVLMDPSGVSIDTLKIVTVSDTHGFEGQLVDPETQSGILPEGDLLLHLGDFALDGSYENEFKGLKAFDRWLAKQPHKYKIVVRGNHDPWTFDFPLSGAWYVTKPMTVPIGDQVLAIVPHGSPRKLSASGGIPSSCDILATHVPPYKSLDRSVSGKHVGSPFLTKVARSMGTNAPRLWLCGHIHECRGVQKRHFGKRETTVINAANANPGRATHLVHGPVVVQVEAGKDNVEILAMQDRAIDKIESNANFFEKSENDSVNELLVAVDLGLKSGVSLFNNQGALLRYEQFYFDKDTLQSTATELIKQWEQDVNDELNAGIDDHEQPWKVTHVAIEGADGFMLNAWNEASPQQSILRVSPEEWRSDLLLSKEKSSGPDAKAASRLIARQVVGDFGVMEPHTGKFPTDVAEAVVMGLYVTRKLGWVTREPAIRRYTNGNIILPK